MHRSALDLPATDPTPIFEHFRGAYATELLTAAVAHFHVFDKLAEKPLYHDELRRAIGLAPRPASVLFTALRAMGLLVENWGNLDLSDLARNHLVAGPPLDVSNYVGLAAQSPGVLEMVERLRTNRPAGAAKEGAAFIFREGLQSAMEQESSARRLTLSLAGRAKNVAPYLAAKVPLDTARLLLDVGGGSGIYSIALLQKNPQLKGIILDSPEVLKVAAEMAEEYGVSDRLTLLPGDMFKDTLPSGCDTILLSNILHDWDVPQCRQLMQKCASALPQGGRLLIHDAFLSDTLDGPLPVALYSAALFTLTEGRAYSAAEYRAWLTEAGMASQKVIPTLIHCGVLIGTKA